MDDLREQLAALAHEQWCGWMRYMLGRLRPNDDGSITISKAYYDALSKQMTMAYTDLPDAEKDSDRAEADKVLAIVGTELAAAEQRAEDKRCAWQAADAEIERLKAELAQARPATAKPWYE